MARRTNKKRRKLWGQIDLRAPLECCEHKQLDRKVGVLVSEPYHHVGSDQQMVEVTYEYPTVNTVTFGSLKTVENANTATRHALHKCIEECARIRREMNEHVTRLTVKLNSNGGIKQASAMMDAKKLLTDEEYDAIYGDVPY